MEELTIPRDLVLGSIDASRLISRKPKKPTVLFLHGLESGTNGRKARYLKKKFPGSEAPDMQMSALNPRKRNSPAKWLIPFAVVVMMSFSVVGYTSSLFQSCVFLSISAFMFVALGRWRMKVALAACVDVAVEAIATATPTVLVGSSWGGAVALRCLELGHWQGPTVLLAPAVATTGVFSLFWPSWRPTLPASVAAQCRIVQGERDRVVPAQVVKEMAKRNGICIELFPDATHSLNEICLKGKGGLETFVMATVSQSKQKAKM